jgi:hypothetical protein
MKIFDEMRSEGMRPTGEMAKTLLEKAKDYQEARSVFGYLQESGVRPELETYTVLLKKTWQFDDAREVFDEMRKADIRPDKIAYTVYLAKAPTYENARYIFNDMKRERVETDAITYTALLDKTHDFYQARTTFEEMLKDGIKPNRGMYTQVMKRATQDEEAEWVVGQMRQAGIGEGTIRRVRGQYEEQKKEEESRQAQASNVYENPPLRQGFLSYNFPSRLTPGEEARCSVRLAFDRRDLFKGAMTEADKIVEVEGLSEVMRVELETQEILSKSESRQPLDIRRISPEEQFVASGDFTEWLFSLKPNSGDEFGFLLKIFAIVAEGGTETGRPVREEIIRVPASGMEAPEPASKKRPRKKTDPTPGNPGNRKMK